MKPVEFLQHYRNNIDYYFPMIDHERKYWPRSNDYGDMNLGWDCGTIGRRPYFLECWSGDGVTIITFFISSVGIEHHTNEEIEKMFIDAGLYTRKEGYIKANIQLLVDSNKNSFFSVNIVVGGEDEDAVIDGAIIYPFKRLNEFNGYTEEE